MFKAAIKTVKDQLPSRWMWEGYFTCRIAQQGFHPFSDGFYGSLANSEKADAQDDELPADLPVTLFLDLQACSFKNMRTN